MGRALKDLVGQTFGRLTVVGRVANDGDGRARFLCRCICGGQVEVRSRSLVGGTTRSCGCYRSESVSQRQRATVKHDHAREGQQTPEYRSWHHAKQRCSNPTTTRWKDYGGRGIRICARWRNSFAAFLADMGLRPNGTTLDRFPNNDGNYEPGNCRWATRSEQQRNQRRARKGVR